MGPKAQVILAPYITAKASTPEAFLFSPDDAVKLLALEKRMNRKSKVQPSQRDRSKPNPMIRPGQKYETGSYQTAIQRAADRANRAETKQAKKEGREPVLLPRWAPNQLRHTWATYVEKEYDAETARIILGHKHVDTTFIYIERDNEKAREAQRKIG
ncbi:MAG TPA: hypothetical protein DEB39_15830 [Planctomycetaceae bacterium]|nr:hypothetical protein [Planctomycetaceae bacterium]